MRALHNIMCLHLILKPLIFFSAYTSNMLKTLLLLTNVLVNTNFLDLVLAVIHVVWWSHSIQAECESRLLALCRDNTGDIKEFTYILSQPGVDPNIFDQVIYVYVA